MSSINEVIQRSIERLRELNKQYIKYRYDDDELEYLNDYATRYDVEQPFFRNIDVIEETIKDLLLQPDWLQLVLHELLIEFLEVNDWGIIREYLKNITDLNKHARIHAFMHRMECRAWEAETRYEMAFELLKDYE